MKVEFPTAESVDRNHAMLFERSGHRSDVDTNQCYGGRIAVKVGDPVQVIHCRSLYFRRSGTVAWIGSRSGVIEVAFGNEREHFYVWHLGLIEPSGFLASSLRFSKWKLRAKCSV